MASSRVGARIRQLGKAIPRDPRLVMCSGTGAAPLCSILAMTGNKKPPVLPEPVCAQAIMSRPA